MRVRFAFAAGAVAAAAVAHGLVGAACYLGKPAPPFSWDGFFQSAVLTLASLWNGDLERFARWFAAAVPFACPALGFLLFCLAARRRPGWTLWRPLLVVSFCALVHPWLYRVFGRYIDSAIWTPWAEAACAALVFCLMVSVQPRRLSSTRQTV